MVYIIESAILNQHLSFSKEKKKKQNIIYKNSKQKRIVRLQLVYIQRNLQVCQFRPLPQTNAHLSLQSTTA